MDLFVLLQTTPRILRVITTAPLQNDLETEVRRQINFFTADKEEIDFDARYRPLDNELLIIRNFDDIDGVLSAVRSPQDVGIWEPTEEGLSTVKALFAGVSIDGKTTVMLQAFDKRQAITAGRFSLFYDQNTFRRLTGVGMTLDNKPTAVLSQNSAATDPAELRFVSLHNVRRLFDMDAYYHESTQEEVNNFFNAEKFHGFNEEWLNANLDNWIRKKVTFINQEGILERCTPSDIRTAAAGFGITVDIEEFGEQYKLTFPEDKRRLKELLRFLDEDIYQSPISGNRFKTNSKTKIQVVA